jgi:hypothetical protein
MEEPKPIDVNKLKSFLNNAKAIMDKVDSGNYKKNLTKNHDKNVNVVENKNINYNTSYKNINKSKLPPDILKAMVENPIPKPNGLTHTFELDDIKDINENEINQNIQNHQTQTFNVSETALRGMIKEIVKEELLNFMNQKYNKSITEKTIKKTISTLIKEGVIKK